MLKVLNFNIFIKTIFFYFFALTVQCCYALDVGDHSKDFALKDSGGNIVTLSSVMEGAEVTVLEFLSIYCDACKKKVPKLNELVSKYEASKVRILAVALANEQPEINAETSSWEARYPILADPDKITFHLYGIHNVPQFFIIDRSGIIRYSGNADNFKDIEKNIEKALTKGESLMQAGDPAPAITLPDSSNGMITIDFSRNNQNTVLGFFTADNKSHRNQAKLLSELYEKAADNKLSVYGIIAASFEGNVREFADAYCKDVPMLIDRSGSVFKQYVISNTPEIILISKSGNIKTRNAPQTYEDLIKLFDLTEPEPSQEDAEQQTMEFLKRAMPQAKTIKPISVGEETFYIGVDGKGRKSYARIVKKDILCEVCSNVEFILTLDQEGVYENFTLIKSFELYGKPIDASGFLQQFIGKSYHQPFVAGTNADIISGATKSSMKFIEGLNETEKVFTDFLDDPSFDANFRLKVCFQQQSDIELAMHLYNREHEKPLQNISDATSYCADGRLPVCPSGGIYTIISFNNIARVMCTVHGLDPESSMIH